eukprot:TRINITY_DN594_c0_g1_i3.p1 TRINITY_DN594_c0_g1~~TRINITY_DN594_c0_g1_i3.p1  ORF type:complete len:215 (-),score=34.64 TRINITY_DN594_c0_g1_i3:28-579(-)
MYSAFNTDGLVDSGDGSLLAHHCTVNDAFRSNAEILLKKIFQLSNGENQKLLGRLPNLRSVLDRGRQIWDTLNTYTSLLGLSSIVEISQRKSLGEIVRKIICEHIEMEFVPGKVEVNEIQRNDLSFKLSELVKKNVEEHELDSLKVKAENIVLTEYEKYTQKRKSTDCDSALIPLLCVHWPLV